MRELILDGPAAADSYWKETTNPRRRIRAWVGKPRVRGFLSLLITLVLATALAFAVELIARGSLSSTLAFFADIHRPGWTTVLLFTLAALAIDALLGRVQGGLIILAPLVLLPAWISSQKGMYLSDPFYPTDFLYGRQIVELLPLLVNDRPRMALAIGAAIVGGLALIVTGFFYWRQRAPKTDA